MRKVFLLSVAGLFMASTAAYAGGGSVGGCGFGSSKSAAAGGQSQTVATESQTIKPAAPTKETKGLVINR